MRCFGRLAGCAKAGRAPSCLNQQGTEVGVQGRSHLHAPSMIVMKSDTFAVTLAASMEDANVLLPAAAGAGATWLLSACRRERPCAATIATAHRSAIMKGFIVHNELVGMAAREGGGRLQRDIVSALTKRTFALLLI